MFRHLDAACSYLWRRAQGAPQAAAAGIALLVTLATVAGLAWLTTRQAPHRLAGGLPTTAAPQTDLETSAAMLAPTPNVLAAVEDPAPADLSTALATASEPVSVTPVGPLPAEPAWTRLPPKEQLVALLEEGAALLERAVDFRAVLIKQERHRKDLGDVEELEVKVRRAPLSVYLKWCDPSPPHEILWRVGQDEDKLLYHDGGWKGRMAPMLKIDPDHKLVRAMSRRPLSKIGPWELARELASRRQDLNLPGAVVTCQPFEGPDGRACLEFSIKHPEPRPELECHCTVLYVDREWKIPVGFDVYDWPCEFEPDPPLIESYYYSQIQFDVGLTDADFDPANEAYGFRKLARK